MADNTVLPVGAGGDTIADEDIAGVKYQQVKLIDPTAGSTTPIGTVANPLNVANTSLPLPTGASTSALQTTGNTSVASLDTKTPALGQQLAAASSPVVLTAAQITTLTPPAAISGFALEAGHLATIDANTPTVGQKAMVGSRPVVIASDQTINVAAASLPLPSGAATAAGQTTQAATLTTLTNLVDQNAQIIKLLAAILMTLGNNGNGFVQPEEASELSTFQ